MDFQKLGRNGLKVSRLSFGSWVTFANQLQVKEAADCMAAAYDAGVNFFDNAEVYAGGESETLMGQTLKKLGWPRLSYLVSTKFFWGIVNGPNSRNTLNRKYLMQAIDGSLARLQLDFVDLVYCHRPDPETPVEETVWAMHDIITAGKALYWGTSEWSADSIREAFEVCERNGLRKPVVEQPQYNLFWRDRVEREYAPLYDTTGIGLTIWSPLASGVLSGKYLSGVPSGSRLSQSSMGWLREEALTAEKTANVTRFVALAKECGCTPAQLAIAWCLHNPHVSSVITGASRVDQVRENMQALDVFHKLDESVWSAAEKIFSV
jgi:voltage-dependent potassium channel beta subunit